MSHFILVRDSKRTGILAKNEQQCYSEEWKAGVFK